MNIDYCPECDKDTKIYTEKVETSSLCHATPVTYEVSLEHCSECKQSIGSMKNLTQGLKAAKEAYYKIHNIDEELLFKIRMKFNLDRYQFAQLLGKGEKTISRYESGALAPQENIVEEYKKLFEDDSYVYELLERNAVIMGSFEKNRIIEILEKSK